MLDECVAPLGDPTHAKLYNGLDEFKKFAILRKGIGIESQNVCKQFKDQKTTETRWNSILWLL